MVKTRTDLEHEIEELTKELDLQRDLKVKAELECEKLRQGLQNALAMATMYEKIIQELEEENKSLTNQVSLHQNESNTNELLEEALEALNLMRLKFREEKEMNDALRLKIASLEQQAPISTRESMEPYRIFADRLCEELVLIDEDIAVLSTLIKPPEDDIYKSNKGRVVKRRSPFPESEDHSVDDVEIEDEGKTESQFNRTLPVINHQIPPQYRIHRQQNSNIIAEIEEDEAELNS